MKNRPTTTPSARLLLAAMLAACGSSAYAASGTWLGNATTTDWNTTANWSAAFPNGTGDTATFSNALSGTIGSAANPITLSASVSAANIVFSGSAGAFNIGAVGAANTITLRGTGVSSSTPSYSNGISVAGAVTNAQVVNTNLLFSAPSSTAIGYSFTNNSTTSSATLRLTGTLTANTATNRATSINFDGSNTGDNTYSGNITSTLANGGVQNVVIAKNGTGKWILSGTNVLSGQSMTSTTGALGVQVNAGVLSLQNNLALGNTSGAQAWINNGGTLELANGITLDNALTLNLNNGGTIRSSGNNSVNSVIKLNATAGTRATISAVGASDVFTIGNAANDLTGGATDTVINVAGSGTVFTTQASTGYLGSWSIGTGTLRSGNSTNGLGVNGIVAFANGSTGKLQLGNNLGLTSLTTNSTTPSAGTVETGAAGTQTLTLTTTGSSSYDGKLQDGTGTLALTKAGTGTLTLSGNSNSYSGTTTVTSGTLKVTNTSGSATGSGNVNLGAATLTGSGIISGTVTTAATSVITPGNVTGGSAGTGTLSLGGLTLISGTTINFGLSSSNASANLINAGALALPGSGTVTLNLYSAGTSTPFATAGTYNLFNYTSLSGGAVGSAFSLGTSITGYTASFGTSSNYVQLILTTAGVIGSWSNGNANGNWSEAGNWSGGVPSAAGDSATFSAASGTINLDANRTVGGVTFNNSSGYTVSGANTLTFDNSGTGASIGVLSGTSSVQTAVALNDNLVVNTAAGTQVSLTGPVSQVSGTRSLTKSGTGTLVLAGNNTYSGGTIVSNGVLNFSDLNALGTGTTLDLGSPTTNGTLQYASGNTADISSLTVTINAGGATIDTNGNNVTFANAIGNAGAGGLTKAGLGKLSLAASNTYSGANTILAGTLNIAADSSLGAVPSGAQTNLTFNPGAGNTATLQAGSSMTLSANRTLVLNSGTAGIDTQSNTVTLAGASSGSGALAKSGSGTLVISSAQSYTGGTSVNEGTLQVNFGGSLAGGLSFANGSTFRLQNIGGNSAFVGNNATIAAGGTATFVSSILANGYSGSLTSGDSNSTILVTGGAQGFNFSASNVKQFANFTGTVNVIAGSSMDSRGTINNNGGDNTTFQIDGFVSAKNNGNWAFGALTGASTGTLGGGVVYTVGAKGIDTVYAGNITTTAATGLIKTGAAKLTLTGTGNTYLATTISNGTLQIGNGGTSGSLGTGAVTNNAVLAFNRSDAITVSNLISGSGSVQQNGNGTTALASGNSYSGGTTINAGLINFTDLSSFGTGNITLNGGGVQWSSGYAGGDLSSRTVTISSGNGTFDTNGNNITLAGSIGNSGTGQLIKTGAGSLSIATLSSTGGTSVQQGSLTIGSGGANGNIATTSGTTTSFSGTSNYTGSISGAGSVAITAGSVNFSGTSSYSGGTSVTGNSTVFILDGSLTGGGAVTVGAGATLGGRGTIIGNTTINGNLAPGNSPGVLTFDGNLTFSNTTVTTMELAGTGGVAGTDFDQTVVTGTLTFDGALNIISYLSFSIDQPGTYDLFAAATAGNFDSVSVGSTALSYDSLSGLWTANNLDNTYLYTFNTSSGDFSVTSAIPEPSTYAALAGLGMIGFALTRRRRHQSKHAA